MASQAAPGTLAAALVLAVAAGCGGAQQEVARVDPAEVAEQHMRRGLELAEDRDFKGALTELEAAERLDPTPMHALAVAHGQFMEGRYQDAVAGYRAFLEQDPALRPAARAEIEAEIARIEEALGSGLAPVGRSLAGSWLRGELARRRAVDSAAEQRWGDATSGFEKAHEHLRDPELLYEAGLAATKGEQWATARAELEAYLAAAGDGIPSQRAFVLEAEIDRLGVIVAGEEPVTWNSLADQIYAERAGEAEPMELPPPAEAEVAELAAKMAGEEAARASAASSSGYQQVPVQPAAGGAAPGAPYGTGQRSLEELLFFAGSKSSSVRLRAVNGLVAQPDDRARKALEQRMRIDTNMRVRFAAVEGLVARRSLRSISAMREAVITAATSQERAVLKRAIADLIESTRY